MAKIIKLELEGFKSFATKTTFYFHPKFNVIIGANGSGKSNVFDAVCFVLGKSSMKDIRAENAKSLIYNGGQSKNPAKQAIVSMYLDNSKKEIPINSEVIKITRIVSQDGTSVYKINDKKTTRREILELLNIIHVNPDGYNIVLQGDIGKIVEMSSIERRQIIEELAGIRIYEEKKEKAINELEKVEQTMKDAEIIINERSERLKNLEQEKVQAEKYLKIEREIKILNASIIRNELIEIENKLKNVNEKIKKFNEKIKENEKLIEELKNEKENYAREVNEISAEIESKSNFADSDLRKRIDECKINLEKTKLQKENYEKELQKITTKKEQLKNSLKELDSKIQINKENLKKLKEELQNYNKQKENIEKEIANLKKEYNFEQLSEIENKIQEIDSNIEKLEVETNELKQKQAELMRKKDRIDFELQNLKSRIEQLKEEQKNQENLKKEIEKKKEQFKNITLKLNDKLTLDSKYSKELSNAREQSIRIEQELGKLRAQEAEKMQHLKNQRLIKFIEELKQKINGIYGFVSDLISVEEKYALAVEISAGNRLNGIVVENEDVALEIIKKLKEEKLGSATFFPLNKIKPNPKVDISKYKNISGVIDLIENLIEYDPKLKNVISYVFSNTLLIENPEISKKVGIGNIRMVSLTGELFETSGVIQGGFVQRQSSGLLNKEIKSKIEKLENDYQNYLIVIRELEQKKQQNINEIYELRKEKAELEAEIIKLEKSISNVEILDDKELKQKLFEIEKELEPVNNLLIKKLQEIAKLKTEKQKLRENLAKAKSPEVVAQLSSFEEKRNQIKQEIIKLEEQIKNNETNLKEYLLLEYDETKKLIDEEEKNEKMLKENIKNFENQLKVYEKEFKELKEKEENIYSEFKDLFKKRQELENLIKEIDIKIYEKESENREIEKEINLIELNNTEQKARYESLKEELLTYNVDEFYEESKTKLKDMLKKYQEELEELGQVNLKAIDEYNELKKNVDELLRKKEELEKEKKEILLLMNEIETKKKEEFLKYFNVLQEIFKQKFSELVEKGEASLELESPETIFDKGVKIVVKLNQKRFLDIKSLSGGEKAITALAFIFSLQEIQPAPFYVFDEVDAPLDKRNAERLGKYIKKYSENAQFILVSHNDAVIVEADTIYGITMNKKDAISSAIALKMEDYLNNKEKVKNTS
ncbi:MAG: chromosome segregation protein SMC [Candidatus Woesearchaeota archaeon]